MIDPVRYPYEDAGLSTDQRVEDLMARLTLEDRVSLIFHSYAGLSDPERSDQYGRPGAAMLVRQRGITHFTVQGQAPNGRGFAEWHNAVQRAALEHPLRIPVTIASDPRHSVSDNPLSSNAAGGFSRWPEPIGLAAIGSDERMREFGDITRREYLAGGIRVALHPQIDLTTEYRWARIVQTLGEDAELTSRLVRAYLEGLQGIRLGPDSVAGVAKHFPGGGPQKDGLDPHFKDGREQIYPGQQFEYHLRPFIAAIDAGVAQIMPYYGMPVGTEWEEVGFAFNKGIVTDLLRKRLGFDGVVVTDFGVVSGYGDYFPAKAWGVEHLSREERVLKLLDAGVDQLGGENDVGLVSGMIHNKTLDPMLLDGPVRRLLREKFRLGLFDERRFVDPDEADGIIGAAEHAAAGRRAQQESMVLLRNDLDGAPLLPLPRGVSLYVEGVEPAAFANWATIVDDPSEAQFAVIRVKSPNYADPAKSFLGSMHKGSLEFRAADAEHINEIARQLPTILDVFMDRPAVLTPFGQVVALLCSFGTDDQPFAELLFGAAQPLGRLPYDLPRSDATVAASRTDVPFDTEAPLFRFGHSLRYK